MGTKGGATKTPVKLRAVGLSDDGSTLVMARRAGAKSGAFRLEVDDALRELLAQAVERRLAAEAAADDPPEIEDEATVEPAPDRVRNSVLPSRSEASTLSPKEIQTLLRRGQSVASVAKKLGVEEAWVERFAWPIRTERAGIASRVRAATLSRPRSGESALPLGDAVRANLDKRKVKLTKEAFEEGWDAVRRDRGENWIVSFTFVSGRTKNKARWEFNPETNEVVALERTAHALGWIAPTD